MLESATFNSSLIRKTARRLGLSSDSSYRFERGVDVAGVLRGSQRARDLLQELAAAKQGALQTSAGNESLDLGALLMGLTPVLQVPLRFERIASLLGAPVPEAKIDQILTSLGLSKSRSRELLESIISLHARKRGSARVRSPTTGTISSWTGEDAPPAKACMRPVH